MKTLDTRIDNEIEATLARLHERGYTPAEVEFLRAYVRHHVETDFISTLVSHLLRGHSPIFPPCGLMETKE